MSTYTYHRFVFPNGRDQFLDVLRDSIPELYVPEVVDEEAQEIIEPRTHLDRVVTPVRETLHVVRNHGTPEAEVVRVIDGEVTQTRVAALHIVGDDGVVTRQRRDANGDLLWIDTGETDKLGDPIREPDMETLPGYHVDVITNVAPETSEQLQALSGFAVTPTHPVRRYAGEQA